MPVNKLFVLPIIWPIRLGSCDVVARIHLIQHSYSLCGPVLEGALIEVTTMRRFVGINLVSIRILDETMTLSLLRLNENNKLGE